MYCADHSTPLSIFYSECKNFVFGILMIFIWDGKLNPSSKNWNFLLCDC